VTAGVDTYIDVAGIPMVYSTGANKFTDEVYNLIWLVDSFEGGCIQLSPGSVE